VRLSHLHLRPKGLQLFLSLPLFLLLLCLFSLSRQKGFTLFTFDFSLFRLKSLLPLFLFSIFLLLVPFLKLLSFLLTFFLSWLHCCDLRGRWSWFWLRLSWDSWYVWRRHPWRRLPWRSNWHRGEWLWWWRRLNRYAFSLALNFGRRWRRWCFGLWLVRFKRVNVLTYLLLIWPV
jgi:hypothetical protein